MVTQTSQISENTPREMDFVRPAAINIGSHPDNDIVLQGAGVRPFHISLVLQNGECQVLPLDAGAEVRLDGRPVETASFKLAGAARRLDIGGNTLLLEHNQAFDGLHVRINPATSPNAPTEGKPQGAAQVAPFVSPAGENLILLNLFSQTGEVEAGQTAAYELEIVNAGALVASFNVFIEGVPQEWVSISPAEINLYEGQHKRVQINITPPRQPDSIAGEHELRVSVFSANYPGYQAEESILLRIKPYYEFILDNLVPRDQDMRWPKRSMNTLLSITNLGNCPINFAASAIDDENGCSFNFPLDDGRELNRQAMLQVLAGEKLLQTIEINPHEPPRLFALRNKTKRYSYTATVQVANQPVAPQTVSGSVTKHSHSVLWPILTTLVTIVLAVFWIFRPGINYFRVDNNNYVIESGDSVTLNGSVSLVTNQVSVSNTPQPLNDGKFSLPIKPTQNTTFDLVAGNWLYGPLHWEQRASLSVLVIPPLPVVDLKMNNLSVATGKSVKISWSVTHADQAFLTVDNVIYDLKDKFSGEQEAALTKDFLVTLDATNTGGHALRSYFIKVNQPVITIKKFIVWARLPDDGKTGLHRDGSGKRASLSWAALGLKDMPPNPGYTDEYAKLNCTKPDALNQPGVCNVVFFKDGQELPDGEQPRELTKGEQVVVEWEVEGAENKIQIAPFSDPLPLKGNQPFFPTESMSFTLTAKSGLVEALHMLPITVFNGAPPTAPKIDFFQAAPLSNVGPVDVQFAWAVSGIFTRIKIASGKIVVGDYLGAHDFATTKVSESGTYILTAWNGENLSSAQPLNITINPNLLDVNIKITNVYPSWGSQFWAGKDAMTVSVSVTAADQKKAAGKPAPTGAVTITDGTSSCLFAIPISSCDLLFQTPGDKYLTVSYSGDSIYSQDQIKDTHKITVTSVTVDLIPSFYLADDTGAKIGAQIDVTSQPFKLKQKLYAVVMIKPLNGGSLVDDDKSKVNYSLCRKSEPSCSNASIPVVAEVINGVGIANILISDFPGAGDYILRFNYSHDDKLLAPTRSDPFNITISRLGIYLTLPPDCAASIPNNKDTGANICSFSYINPRNARIEFDIHQTNSGDYLDTTMPRPKLYFTDPTKPFWRVYDANSNKSFACDIGTKTLIQESITRSVYTLVCPVDATGKGDLLVNYQYNNNAADNNKVAPDYYMGAEPTANFSRHAFHLQPANQTTIKYTKKDYLVGEIISLTPNGVLSLVTAAGNKITNTTGTITFSASSTSQSAAGLLDVVPGSTCAVNASGDAIVNINVGKTCKIFFRHVGLWDVEINFSGGGNYAPDSISYTGSNGINVSQQTSITTTWVAKQPSFPKWDGLITTTGTSVTGQIIFSAPPQFNFSSKALDGVMLSLTQDNPTCSLNPPIPPLITYQNAQAVFTFTVICPMSPRPARVNLALEFAGTQDFSFDTAPVNPARQVLFVKENIGSKMGGVYFELASDRIKDANPFVFDWQSTTPPSPKNIPLLYAGETYTLRLMYEPVLIFDGAIEPGGCAGKCNTLDDVLNLIRYKTPGQFRKINITLPLSWAGRVSASGNCTLNANTISVPLNYIRRSTSFNGWSGWSYAELSSPDMTDSNQTKNTYTFDNYTFDTKAGTKPPCKITFSVMGEKNLPLGKNSSVKFLFDQNFTEPTLPFDYTADETYSASGLTKVLAKSTIDPVRPSSTTFPFKTAVAAGSLPQSVTMKLSNPFTLALPWPAGYQNLSAWFTIEPAPCMGPKGLTGKVVGVPNPATQTITITWTMNPPKVPCAGRISISYNENTYFQRKVILSQPVQFTRPNLVPTAAP